MGKIVYYTSKSGDCKPCGEINKLVEAGQFVSPDGEVDLVDITTDEGFDRFNKEILSKQDGAVPTAYKDGQKCQIILENGQVFFECDPNNHEAPEPKSSLPEKDGSHDGAQSSPQDEPPGQQS
jgi:hypothetical protein